MSSGIRRYPDVDAVSGCIRDVVTTAILPRFQRLAHGDIREKSGPHDLLTVADLEAERMLTSRLSALMPGSIVIGEEAVAGNPRLVDALREPTPAWLIDPIDGTANFAAGIPLFGTMIALVVNGETRMAWIHDPIRGVTLTAESGSGAYAEGRRLKVAAPKSLAHMAGVANLRYGERDLAARIGARADRVAALVNFRCAAQDYVNLAEGRLHFAFYQRLNPWDHAPGVLIVTEAGGYARRLDGTPYRPTDPPFSGPFVVASDEQSWHWLRAALFAP